MYKLTTNISEVNSINTAQSKKEIGSSYCEINKHCNQELYAIPIIESILKSYNLDFITDSWLNSNIVENIPNDWNWHSPYKTKRFIIPNSLIVQSIKDNLPFKEAIDKIVEDSKIDTEILIIETSNNTIVYANSVDSSIEGVVMEFILNGTIIMEDKL